MDPRERVPVVEALQMISEARPPLVSLNAQGSFEAQMSGVGVAIGSCYLWSSPALFCSSLEWFLFLKRFGLG